MPRRPPIAIAVDWSARSAPATGRDSIWLAIDDGITQVAENPPTRALAEQRLRQLLVEGLDRSAEVVVGIDVSLGYPDGTVDALGFGESTIAPWRSMWSTVETMIVDDAGNRNNRFEVAAALNERIRVRTGRPGPFWGCPSAQRRASLTATKPDAPSAVRQWRRVERVLRNQGRRPFSCWQLYGAGAVGSQTLLAIPMLERLRRAMPQHVRIWPFERQSGAITVVEVWPTLLDVPVGGVRDEAQVRAAATWLRHVGTWWCPEGVDHEEGWIAGVGSGGSAQEEVPQ